MKKKYSKNEDLTPLYIAVQHIQSKDEKQK